MLLNANGEAGDLRDAALRVAVERAARAVMRAGVSQCVTLVLP